MISSNQIKAARALLRWSLEDLATYAEVGSATIKRLESERSSIAVRSSTIAKIERTLEHAGVEFTGTDQHKPGVCLDLEKHAVYLEALRHDKSKDD